MCGLPEKFIFVYGGCGPEGRSIMQQSEDHSDPQPCGQVV